MARLDGRRQAESTVLSLVGWASAYAAMAWIGSLTRAYPSRIALVWPAAGIGFLWVLLARARCRSALLTPLLILAMISAALNATTGVQWQLACALGVINVFQATLSVLLFCRITGIRWPRAAGGTVRLRDLRGLHALAVASVCGATAAAPLAGFAAALTTSSPFASTAGQWLARNAVSTVIVASVGLVDPRPLPRRVPAPRIGELAVFLALTALLFVWVFDASWGRPFVFIAMLLPVWSGLRLGLRVTTVHLVCCGTAAVLLTMIGSGPFGEVAPMAVRATAVQVFVGLIAVVGLGLAAGRRARLALDMANERSALLGEVSLALSESLDLDRTLNRLVSMVTPRFCDHCVVDLFGQDGRLRRYRLAHAPDSDVDGVSWTPTGALAWYDERHPVAEVISSGRGQIVLRPPSWRDTAPSGAATTTREPRLPLFSSALVVPLLRRSAVIGAVTLISSTSARVYGAEDLDLATQIADRAAMAIDNAMLFQHEQRISLTLQHSLIPDRLPAAPGLQVAARYLAAAEGGAVGGDWYDLLPLPTGRVAIVVGDVMGRGVAAAALMGQVRAALRAYAGQDLPPAEVLAHADELVRGLADETIVTCVYGVYDPREHQLVLSNAGHIPPLVLGSSTAAAGVDPPGAQPVTRIGASGPALGAAGAEPYSYVTIDLPASHTLALYTDGLVESRTANLESNIRVLEQELCDPGRELETICQSVLTRIDPDRTDDAALLLVRPTAGTGFRVARRTVLPHGHEVGACRTFTAETLGAWGTAPASIESAVLLVSELVTNAVRYARPPLSLLVSAPVAGIVIEVRDHGGTKPRLRRAQPDDEGGRGLMLVAALAARWGTRNLPDGGKAVWCQLAEHG